MKRSNSYLIVTNIYIAAAMVISGNAWIPFAFAILNFILCFATITEERKIQ